MLHETLHSADLTVSNIEEGVNLSLEIPIYLEQLSTHPWLASTGTQLSRRANATALVRLNSGAGDHLGLFDGNGSIFPGSPTETSSSWWEEVDTGDTRSTPGNELLQQVLDGYGGGCSGMEFSIELLHCISDAGVPLSDEELLDAARAMRLDVPAP